MTNPIAMAVLSTGLVDHGVLAELKRWGVEIPEVGASPPRTWEEASRRIQEAIESKDYVLVRETDLEVLRSYMSTSVSARLHLVIDGQGFEQQETEFEVTYCRTATGAYVIPWHSEAIMDAMINGSTYLDVGTRVYFDDVRELYFGDIKVFMVCMPTPVKGPDTKQLPERQEGGLDGYTS